MAETTKLTPKQENFVLAYLETGNASEAYRRSYSAAKMSEAAINVEACNLLKHPNVALRLQVLQERAASKVVLTRSFVLDGLMANAKAAALASDFTASNKAYELLGKTDEVPLFVERSIVQSDNRHHHTVDPVSTFDGFLEEAAGSGTEGDTAKSVPN